MAEDTARPRFQRARREAEKAERRAAILGAAGALLAATGFEGFSMSVLARKSGIAKGTLYLYFETREEVLLALFVEKLAAFNRALLARLEPGMADEAFARAFQEASAGDPAFLALRARLESVIEHNVSLERLVEAKRAMRSVVEALAPRVEEVLGLAPGTGAPLVVCLGALHVGAAQSETGPAAAGLDLPEDVAEFMNLHRELDVFREAAPMIIAGMRRGAG